MRRIHFFSVLFLIFICPSVFALPFTNKLDTETLTKLNNGETVIRSIDYAKNMSLQKGANPLGDELLAMVKSFSPKYLGEVILIKPYKGNEDLPERIRELLFNIESYTDIPYYSERAEQWYKLYDEAKITNSSTSGNKTIITTDLMMEPFGLVQEQIDVIHTKTNLYYSAFNTNSLSYQDIKGLLGPKKMRIGIVVFQDGDNWIIYGVGGANAPHIPFLTDRIRVSLINRICSFCTYIFKKL